MCLFINSVCLAVSLSVGLSVYRNCLSVRTSIHLSISIYPPVYLSIYLSVCSYKYQFIFFTTFTYISDEFFQEQKHVQAIFRDISLDSIATFKWLLLFSEFRFAIFMWKIYTCTLHHSFLNILGWNLFFCLWFHCVGLLEYGKRSVKSRLSGRSTHLSLFINETRKLIKLRRWILSVDKKRKNCWNNDIHTHLP